MNWMDVEKYLSKDDRLMIILGACEQHGYLSLLTDIKIPSELAESASQKTGVPVAPPLNFGFCPFFLSYPGVISLRAQTLMDVFEDIVSSVYRAGFRRLLVVNGHGGNMSVASRIDEMLNVNDRFPKLRVRWYSWWESPAVTAVAKRHGLKPDHANWLEAFPFTRICELPKNQKAEAVTSPWEFLNAERMREIHGDGVFGSPYQASDEVMDEIFKTAVEEIFGILKFE